MIIDSYIDLCSGIGCFPFAMQKAGIEIKNHFFSEIDKQAISNYKYKFPNAQYIGPIGHFSENVPARCDFISAGFPCQDLSIAGKRKGIKGGTRSGLIFKIAEIIRHYQPGNFLLENVPGLLSHSKGITILEILELLTDLSTDSPQYDVEMSVLNTRYFGIPQNRERLYFIGHNITQRRSRKKVFPLTKSDCLFVKSTKGQSNESQYYACVNKNGNLGQIPIANCIDSNYAKGMDKHGQRTVLISDSGKSHKYEIRDSINDTTNSQALEIIQINPSKESGGKQPYQQNRVYSAEGISPAYQSGLTRGGNIFSIPNVQQKAYSKGNGQAQRVYDLNGIAPSQGALGGGQGGDRGLFEMSDKNIRRFTPIEISRLFGLPDDFTKYGIDEKGNRVSIADYPRYRMLGNGIPTEPLTTIIKKLFS